MEQGKTGQDRAAYAGHLSRSLQLVSDTKLKTVGTERAKV